MKKTGELFADKTKKIYSKIELVNALTPKELSNLNKRYLNLGLYIRQVVVDNYGNEQNKKEPDSANLLGKKRYRNNFNSLQDFLNKYYGNDDSFSMNKRMKKNKTNNLSENENAQKISEEDLCVLKNGLNSIKEDCQKIGYKICLIENNEFKSKIIDYIFKFKKYLTDVQYSLLFNKWKNEFSKIKGIDLFNSDDINNLFNWKVSILKSFKSEIALYCMTNICDNLLNEDNKCIDNKINDDKCIINDNNIIKDEEHEEHKLESTVSDLNESSDYSDDETNFDGNQALLLQLVKNARNEEENL